MLISLSPAGFMFPGFGHHVLGSAVPGIQPTLHILRLALLQDRTVEGFF